MNLPPLRKTVVAIGYSEIHLVSPAEIENLQTGFSVKPDGQDRTGECEGDWLKEWTVIGYDGLIGDPIFVDSSNPQFPVYTAAHGQGHWEADLVSGTFGGFLQILERLRVLSVGRDNPVALENNPLPKEDITRFLDFASEVGDLEDTSFWELILEND